MSDLLTTPKPFVLVLMPFDRAFDDIYKFGIKGAAQDVGAYAERVDEQMFSDGILDRIFNQISRADVIVADMTDRNPNVFYEVGYAHALGKIVLLLTQRVEDIPFDLKHRQHTVYGGSIEALRKELIPKLEWAVAETKRRKDGVPPTRFSVRLAGVPLPSNDDGQEPAQVLGKVGAPTFPLSLHLRNDSPEVLPSITHIYLFCNDQSSIVPTDTPPETEFMRANTIITHSAGRDVWSRPGVQSFVASAVDSADGLTRQYRLPISFTALPAAAVEERVLYFRMPKPELDRVIAARLRLRLHTASDFCDYTFDLSAVMERDPIFDVANHSKRLAEARLE